MRTKYRTNGDGKWDQGRESRRINPIYTRTDKSSETDNPLTAIRENHKHPREGGGGKSLRESLGEKSPGNRVNIKCTRHGLQRNADTQCGRTKGERQGNLRENPRRGRFRKSPESRADAEFVRHGSQKNAGTPHKCDRTNTQFFWGATRLARNQKTQKRKERKKRDW